MNEDMILLLRAGYYREFALKTLLRKNCNIIVIDKPTRKEAAYGDYNYMIDDIWDPEKMFRLAVDIYKQRKYNALFSFCDSSIIALGMLSDYFGLDYFSEKTARTLCSKLEVRKYLSSVGYGNVKFQEINTLGDLKEAADSLNYPFILKPSNRTGSKGVVVIRASEELEDVYQYVNKYSRKSSLIAEEFIDGDEYCVEVIISDRNPFVIAVTKKIVTSDKYCIELAAITPAPLTKDSNKRIEEYISNIVSKFDISNTVLHIEIKMTNDQIKIVEINPRPAGGGVIENIFNLKGLNIYDYAFDISFKKKIDYKKLESEMQRPFEKYAVFYPFINPVRSGVLKSINGIDKFQEQITSDLEKLILLYDEGQFLPEPKTNEEARGYIYLMDQDYDKLLSRLYKMEGLLEFKFDE